MKTVLITGASSGFGQLVAERLLAEGHTVYAATLAELPPSLPGLDRANGASSATRARQDGHPWSGDRHRRLDDLRNAMAHYDATSIADAHGPPLDLLVRTLSRVDRSELSLLLDQQLEAERIHFIRVVAKGALGRWGVRL